MICAKHYTNYTEKIIMENNYHQFVFDKIKNSQPVILLSGPSIKNLSKCIHELNYKNIIYYSVNNKFIVERNILSKIDRKVNVWQINCTIAIKKFAKEIIEFLSDDDSLLFLTTSEALSKIFDILDINKHKINFSKIFLLDHLHYNLCKTIDNQYTPADWGKINALGFMISFISLLEIKKDIYLFGCDGLKSPDNKNVYYGQNDILKKRVANNLANNIIYSEMMLFNNRWQEITQSFLSDREIKIPQIYNVNPDSYYTCFDKISFKEAFAKLTSIKENYDDFKKFNFIDNNSLNNNLDLYIKIHNLHLSLAILNNNICKELITEKQVDIMKQEKYNNLKKLMTNILCGFILKKEARRNLRNYLLK